MLIHKDKLRELKGIALQVHNNPAKVDQQQVLKTTADVKQFIKSLLEHLTLDNNELSKLTKQYINVSNEQELHFLSVEVIHAIGELNDAIHALHEGIAQHGKTPEEYRGKFEAWGRDVVTCIEKLEEKSNTLKNLILKEEGEITIYKQILDHWLRDSSKI